MFAGMIHANNNKRLANELLIEHIRTTEFSEKVSRLRGLFLFGDRKSAQKATVWGGHFILENLAEVDAYTKSGPTKLDANWITHFKRREEIITEDSIEDIRKYWGGEPYDSNPCWEYLIDGYAKILSASIKKRAYEEVKNRMPKSLDLLKLSKDAFLLDSDLGHCIPWIQRISPTEFELKFLMNFKDAKNRLFLNKLYNLQMHRKKRNFNQVSELICPDLRQFYRKFSMSDYNLYGYSNLKIHLNF